MSKVVLGIARTKMQTEAIVHQLHVSGFLSDRISVLLPGDAADDGGGGFVHERHTKAPEGAAAGAGTGGVVGGAFGLLAGVGSIVVPGLGALVAAGPILATLSGAAAGAAVGGVAGALIGLGIPEYEARYYEGTVGSGSTLIAVHTEDAEERARAARIFDELGARDVGTLREDTV
jgi:hypothetical protein